MFYIMFLTVLIISSIAFAMFLYKLYLQMCVKTFGKISMSEKIKLASSGIVAFFADALGIGGFAVNIAFYSSFKFFKTSKIPEAINIVQIVPGALSSLLFLKLVEVDATMLFSLVVFATFGGISGAFLATKLNEKVVKSTMFIALLMIIIILLLKIFNVIKISENNEVLTGISLVYACIGVFVCGFMTAFGVGLFMTIQIVLLLSGVPIIIAFPIMTTAGAIQQPFSSMTFLCKPTIDLRKIFFMSGFGIIGVLIAVPLVIYKLPPLLLYILLLCITAYNVTRIFLSLKEKSN